MEISRSMITKQLREHTRRRILLQPSNSVAHVGFAYTPLLILQSESTFSVLIDLKLLFEGYTFKTGCEC
jgi:hypothetical protein